MKVGKKTLAACIMCQDDEDCLRENIDYHSLIGIEHFFIYDNNSKMPLSESLKDYDNVTVINWDDNKQGSHCRCFQHCIINHARDKFKWTAFIDTDEFIVMKDENTDLKEFLKPYSDFGGLGINWKMMGSSGHETKQKSVIESFTHVAGSGGTCIKTIANLEHIAAETVPITPHSFYYHSGKFSVNERKKRISSSYNGAFNSPATYDKIQINHYFCRSKEEWKLKQKRGGGNRRTKSGRSWGEFQSLEVKDTAILELIERIKNND